MKVIQIDSAIGTLSGELSARWLRGQLPSTGEDITLSIHSEGGACLEALAMCDLIQSYPGKVTAIVSSMALSAASLVTSVCDSVSMTENAMLMVHGPHNETDTEVSPSDKQLLAMVARRMTEIYARKSGQSPARINQMMTAETWLDAASAVKSGLADRVIQANQMRTISARAIPQRIVARIQTARGSVGTSATATARWKNAVAARALSVPKSQAILAVDESHPGLRQRMIDEANGR